MINSATRNHIIDWGIPKYNIEVSNVVFDENGYVLEADVSNGGWLLLWNGASYDACDYDRTVVNENIYQSKNAIHYTEMKPCNEYGEELTASEISEIITNNVYEYQPGKTLVETIESYQKCLVDGSDGNIDYLYKKLLEQAKSADKIANTFTNTRF